QKRKHASVYRVKRDFGLVLRGYYGDAARTVPVCQVSAQARALVEATRESLTKAISAVISGNRIGDIGHAVQSLVESRGFAVVRDFVGHGLGKKLHHQPQLPNFAPP